MIIGYLLEKEFKHIMRNAIIPKIIIALPVMIMLILPFAANSEVHNINIAVVDTDQSNLSARLSEQISASTYFQLVQTTTTYHQALQGIEAGTTDVILTISKHFGRDLMLGKLDQPQVAANSVDAIKAAMGSQYLQSIVSDFVIAHLPPTALNNQSPTQPLIIQTQNRFNPHLNYKFFMIPALMVMLLTIMCGFLPALNVVQEKETGTIEQMNVTPISKATFILSKIIPYWVIGLLTLTISFLLSWLVYGLVAAGSYLTIYAASLVLILSVSGLGLIISSRSANMQQTMFVVFFFVIIMVLLSGLFTPVESMPEWAQWITRFNPLTYFIRVMRGVYLKGSNLADIAQELYILGAFAAVLNTWAILSYRKRG